MRTAQEIAREIVNDETAPEEWSPTLLSDIRAYCNEAIEADRAQRDLNEDGTLHGAAIIALEDRGEGTDLTAAEWIEANPDEFWETYAGPMIDQIEQEQGR